MIESPALRLAAIAAVAVAAITGAALLYAFDPSAPGSLFPGCLFHRFTGLYCPGCGMTRMLHALLHGDLARAASMNVFALAGMPALGVMAVHETTGHRLLPRSIRGLLYDGRLWIAAMLAFGVLRNLPWAPFTALAPG